MTQRLFPDPPRPPKPRKPRRPNRVMGLLSDAGCCHREYTCLKCALEWNPSTTTEDDAKAIAHFERHGTNIDAERMCPRCNSPEVFSAWGESPDEYVAPVYGRVQQTSKLDDFFALEWNAAIEAAALLIERVRCRQWSPEEAAWQIRTRLKK